MNITAKSSPDEMVLEWLKAELVSERFESELRLALHDLARPESIITNADLSNHEENLARRAVLKKYRSWLAVNIDDYLWRWAELDRSDVGGLTYIDYDYWNELSSGTGLVGEATHNIEKGMVVFDVPNDNFYSVAENVVAGKTFPPIILIPSRKGGGYQILEGHVRATGYVLAEGSAKPLIGIIGTLA